MRDVSNQVRQHAVPFHASLFVTDAVAVLVCIAAGSWVAPNIGGHPTEGGGGKLDTNAQLTMLACGGNEGP